MPECCESSRSEPITSWQVLLLFMMRLSCTVPLVLCYILIIRFYNVSPLSQSSNLCQETYDVDFISTTSSEDLVRG